MGLGLFGCGAGATTAAEASSVSPGALAVLASFAFVTIFAVVDHAADVADSDASNAFGGDFDFNFGKGSPDATWGFREHTLTGICALRRISDALARDDSSSCLNRW